MHLIKVVRKVRDDKGQFYGCKLELSTLLPNKEASIALYVEMWHRLRRDHIFRSKYLGVDANFDASIYLKQMSASTILDNSIPAAILLNTVEDSDKFSLDKDIAEEKTMKSIHFMDHLLTLLLDEYAEELDGINLQFIALQKAIKKAEHDIVVVHVGGKKNTSKNYHRIQVHGDLAPSNPATIKVDNMRRAIYAELKALLKEFCRKHGLFIDDSDVDRARAQDKATRRLEAKRSGVHHPRHRKKKKGK